MSSAAQPVNQPDALRLLLDRLGRGADAALIAGGDGGRVLLDLVADCLSGQRIRTLWAAEVLPSSPAAPTPDNAALARSFQALTMLDGTCDRIVLLVGDADALPHSALRYIQFASRAAPHLQLVFCGTRAFLDTLGAEEFAHLRGRLTAGPVLALAAPITEDAPPPAVPDEPPSWVGEAAAPLPDAWGPAVSVRRRSRALPLGALALLGLALLGLGGAAGFVLGGQGAPADRPAASQQAASQPPTLPDASAPGTPGPGVAFRADPEPARVVPEPARAASDTPPPPSPVTAGGAQGASPGLPPGGQTTPPAAVPGPVVTVRSQPRSGLPEDPRPSEPPTGPTRSLGRSNASAAPSRAAAAAALDNRMRRLREAQDQAAPPRDDEWASSQPAFGSWTAPDRLPPRYIGSYSADANGVRVFHPEP